MASIGYRYELRRKGEIVATGHLSYDDQLQVGSELTIGGHRGIIQSIEPLLGSRESRLVIDVAEDDPSR